MSLWNSTFHSAELNASNDGDSRPSNAFISSAHTRSYGATVTRTLLPRATTTRVTLTALPPTIVSVAAFTRAPFTSSTSCRPANCGCQMSAGPLLLVNVLDLGPSCRIDTLLARMTSWRSSANDADAGSCASVVTAGLVEYLSSAASPPGATGSTLTRARRRCAPTEAPTRSPHAPCPNQISGPDDARELAEQAATIATIRAERLRDRAHAPTVTIPLHDGLFRRNVPVAELRLLQPRRPAHWAQDAIVCGRCADRNVSPGSSDSGCSVSISIAPAWTRTSPQ